MSGRTNRVLAMAEAGRLTREDTLWLLEALGEPAAGRSLKEAARELRNGAGQVVRGVGRIFRAVWAVLSQLAEAAAWNSGKIHNLTMWRETPEEIAKGGK